MGLKLIHFLIWIPLLAVTLAVQAQEDLELIQQHLKEGALDEADSAITSQINHYQSVGNYQALIFHGYYLGKIELERGDPKSAVIKTDRFIKDFVIHADAHHAYEAVLDLAWIHDEIGDIQRAYEMNLQAQEYCLKSPDCTNENLGLLEYNLGARSLDLGQVAQSMKHMRKALEYYLRHPNISSQRLYQIYNGLGAVAFQNSKIDSAIYYYHLSLEKVEASDETFYEKSRQKMYVYANLADAYAESGNLQKSNEIYSENISNYQILIDSTDDIGLAVEARRIMMSSWADIALNYLELGDTEKSYELSRYVYGMRKKHLQPSDPDIIKSLISVGSVAARLHRMEEAKGYFERAIALIDSISGAYLRQDANAHFELGKVNYHLGNTDVGSTLFDRASDLYQQSLKNSYNIDYLIFLKETALIYAQNRDTAKALKSSLQAWEFTKSVEQGFSFNHYKQTLNLAEIYFELGDYPKCLETLDQAKVVGAHLIQRSTNLLDSVQINNFMPTAIYLRSHAQYLQQTKRNPAFLINLLSDLEKAIGVLENQKPFISSSKSMGILHSSNKDLFDFAKKLNLELYDLTNQQEYVDRIITMHESNMYNRIRTRLNQRKSMSFQGVPEQVIQEEQKLKNALTSNLVVDSTDESLQVKSFLTANENWRSFLATIKKDYPRYYYTRYASILEPLKDLQMPPETSLVRYLYIEDDLYSLVVLENQRLFYKLPADSIKDKIMALNQGIRDIETLSKTLLDLYQQLWSPFAKDIVTPNVVIIPDADLFNLSFEVLTPERISSYGDFTTNSLLAKHTISYNYSSVLLGDKKQEYRHDLVAFAPGFSTSMKEKYQSAIGDTLKWDHTYLTLLSQPFSVDLANSVHRLFSGEVFMEEQSTEANFKKQANDHKIIHIGTHAESNNHNPELSRLIFAKDLEQNDLGEDNSLYAYEIYNCQLGSNLTVLTACETGKPSYQSGEGMISLAHAFNYAGSESLLTSLWKIDEVSSAKIVNSFYNYLSAGDSKDHALRKAKLDYIASAKGRTANPQYWAGLIIMGDVAPIDLDQKFSFWYYLLGLLLIAVLIFFTRKAIYS